MCQLCVCVCVNSSVCTNVLRLVSSMPFKCICLYNIVFLNSSYLLDYLSLSFSQTVRVLHHHELDSTDDGRAMLLPAGLASGTAIVSPNGACTSGLTALVAQAAHGQGPPSRLASTERSFSAGPSFMPSECIRWSSVSSGRPAPSICWSRKFWLTKEYFF